MKWLFKKEKHLTKIGDDYLPVITMYVFLRHFCISLTHREYLPHNHQTNYYILVLWGGYKDKLMDENGKGKEYVRKPGHFYKLDAKYFHNPVPLKGTSVSLLIKGKYTGNTNYFLVDGKKRNYPQMMRAVGFSKEYIRKHIKLLNS